MPFLHEIKAKIWICTQFCKIIGLIFFFPGCGDFCHSVGLGAGGDVDVGFHRLVVGVAGPFHDYLGRDAAGEGEADEGASAGCVPDDGAALDAGCAGTEYAGEGAAGGVCEEV